MTPMNFDKGPSERILSIFKTPDEEITTRTILERLGYARAQRRSLRSDLKDMEARGELREIGKDMWALPEKDEIVEGELSCHRDGYGFVARVPEDLFIPPGDMGSAMHGDVVRAKVMKRQRSGRVSGKILEIVKRARLYIVGKYDAGFVYPSNERLLHRYFVPKEARRGVVDGELAEVKIVKYPESTRDPEGEIMCRLGSFDDPSIDLKIIISEHDLPREFPPEVLKEAAATPPEVGDADRVGREDLRGMNFMTVDPESARDFDDAVCVKRESGGYRLWVAIADVTHYVRPGTALDAEAIARSTSIYFPEGVIPMLPEDISAGVASLKPDVERLALVAELRLDRDGNVEDEKFYPAVIRSKARLSYDQVSRAMLDKDPDERERIKPTLGDLEIMLDLAAKLKTLRRKRGGLDFDLPESMVLLGAEGEVMSIVKSIHDRSHGMIEEFMLAANEAVARYMDAKGVPAMYRAHDDPLPDKLLKLSDVLGAFGLSTDFSGMKSRDISRKIQSVMDRADGKPYELIVNTACLRSMKVAKYESKNIGHFGLAADHYLHFTSPIRRYPDLFTHRMLKDHLAGKPTRRPADIDDLCAQCSSLERRAEQAERDMGKLKAARFMKDKIGEEYDGIVSGVASFGVFVEIADHFVEGFIHETRLPFDDWNMDERTNTLRGRKTGKSFKIGDVVKIVVTSSSIEKRQIDFDLIGPKAGPKIGPKTDQKTAPNKGPKMGPKKKGREDKKSSRSKRSTRARR